MITSSLDLLDQHPEPSEDAIRHGLEGNPCRSTGYQTPIKAVQTAASEARQEVTS
jgi:carbon-monoxide dehydrogenase small subunit